MNEQTDPQPPEIIKAFVEYVQHHGSAPNTLSEFCLVKHLESSKVRKHYRTISAIEKAAWAHWFEETFNVLNNSAEYKDYNARERLLSFYYTWLDTIKPARSYVQRAPKLPGLFSALDLFLGDVEKAFLQYTHALVKMASAGEEIVARPVITNYYNRAVWQQFLFIMNFWIKDKSEEQSKTDEAIERSVNLLFELAARNQMDAIIDFGKFLFKSRQ